MHPRKYHTVILFCLSYLKAIEIINNIHTFGLNMAPEVETPIEIWPFRFLKGVRIFVFIQIVNLAVQIFIFFKTQI